MHFERLSKQQGRIVKEVLRAASDGPFFPDGEFDTLFGLTRVQVQRIANEWPFPNVSIDEVERAVNSAFNNLLGYPHRKHELWKDWISVDERAVDELFRHLGGERR